VLPTALRRSRRRARIVAETTELIVRNSEGLRWAILRALDETFRAAASQLDDRLSEAIAATQGVLRDVLVRRRDHSFIVRSALQRLDGSKQEMAAIREALIAPERAAYAAP
jgi:hypothetical protein